ncbi:MAG: DegQ family serine endoprotease [Rhodocyclaceae bacterium]|nr:DegQ family serine endoprotease [Rhodocyclaceae bacterium]MBX3669861.1 DegQ family serine endoprotease [Rhodocyclaceae bacterium]
MNSRIFSRAAVATALIAVLGTGAGLFETGLIRHAQAVPPAVAPAPAAASPAAPAMRVMPDFASIVERVGPAVVNISVVGSTKSTASPFGNLDPNDPFFEFFRRFRVPGGPPEGQPARGLGSGFIVSPDGVVLTNAHVVADASEVVVKLTDRREFKAKIVGIDKATDVAVLKIDAKNLPTVSLGDPARTRVGEWVLAIGSPFGFENSVTAGIVSAKSRSLPDDNYVPFIQTDVAVNPGNSGGPLINLNGEVVGINSQIFSRSGGYQGLSFAIPIDVAQKVQSQLLAHGKVTRGWMGVGIQRLDQALAESFGLKNANGALVSSVEKGSPAARAGLEPGDVILKFNGQDIGRERELPPLVADVKPGTSVPLEVWRKRQTRQMSITLGELPSAKLAGADDAQSGERGRLGLAVRPLTPDERRDSDLSGGLVVQQVTGPAARAGIQPGDLILQFNGEQISSVEQLRSLVAKAGKRAAILIQRNDAKIFVPIELG